MTQNSLTDSNAAALHRERQLWEAEPLNGQARGRAAGSLAILIFQVGDWSTRKQRRGRKDVSDMLKATQEGCCSECRNPHFSLHPAPSSLHTQSPSQSCGRASMGQCYCGWWSPRGDHGFTGAEGSKSACSSWIHPAEKGAVCKWVLTSCCLGSRRQSWQQSPQ